MPEAQTPTPLAGLLPVGEHADSLMLKSPEVVLQVSALAPDLFRIRAVRGRRFSRTYSWAVRPSEWPAPEVRIRRTGTSMSLQTTAGTFKYQRKTGAWEVSDPTGIRVFTATAGCTAFAGREAQLTLELVDGESLFGLGETTGTFNRRGLVRDFWNTDVLGHAPAIHPGLRQLYVSIPFAVSLRDGRAAGLFWDNPARQYWDLGQSHPLRWTLRAASGELDLYLFLGPGVPQVLDRYTQLTGRVPLPPRWALGYHQSRYSYESAARVRKVAGEFRRRRLPCDAIHLDIHHMDAFRVFTFGRSFARPATLIRALSRQGFRVVTIVDPGVKHDRRFPVLRRGAAAGAFVKAPAGNRDFLGRVWPGTSRFPDFLNETTRRWWGDEQAALQRVGVAGFWNDMNEPANFARPDKTLDPRCRHRTDAGPRRHAEVHNVYGMEMARASQEGARRHRPDERPFIISRAGYAGIQRHALVWTGDNSSHWDHLNDAVQMLLNLSLSGVAFCGSDVGGFLDNATPELFARWLQFAAFTPFFRSHTNLGTVPQEPWAFGPEVEEISRRYLHLRYQLLPLLEGLFAEARVSGAPIMRPLLWHYPNDPVAVACGDQFLLGRDLLVAPVLRQGARARSVYLPNDLWYDFWTGEGFQGGRHVVAEAPLEVLPLYVRAGGMVPMTRPEPCMPSRLDPLVFLHCWPGASGECTWYEDDGCSNNYEAGVCLRRRLRSQTARRTFQLEFGEPEGPFPSAVTTWRLILRGVQRAVRFRINGREASGTWIQDSDLFVADVPNRPEPLTVTFTSVKSP